MTQEVKDKIEEWLKPYFPEVPIENCTGPVDYEQRNTLHKRNCLRKGAEFGYTLKIEDNENKLEECLIKAIRVVRHSRNVLYSVSVEEIRSEGVMTEIELEEILGKEEYQRLCEKAFKKGE